MKIRLEHKYIGAALMQIAEHENFTAINAMKIKRANFNNAFKINNNIGLLCKYASQPNANGEYVFTFTSDHLKDFDKISKNNDHSFVALICVQDDEICCLSAEMVSELIAYRKSTFEGSEDALQVLVTAETGRSLRAYVNAAGRKNVIAGKQITVPRNAFPSALFG